MKTQSVLPTCLLALLTALSLQAAPAENDRARVIFFEPDRFTDVKDQYMESDKGRDAILDQLRDYVVDRAGKALPEGQKVTITFTDIDMAGDFEPGRGPRLQDVRIVKDIYPPRINLSFKVVDADGNVVKQGERQLRDLSFLMKLSISQSDPLRHEKALLDDWIRSDLRLSK